MSKENGGEVTFLELLEGGWLAEWCPSPWDVHEGTQIMSTVCKKHHDHNLENIFVINKMSKPTYKVYE